MSGFVFSSESSVGINIVRSATKQHWDLTIGEPGRDLLHMEAFSENENKSNSEV